MKLNFTNVSIIILFISVIGLTTIVLTKDYEVFENKNPDEAYVDWVSHTEYIAGDSTGQAIIRVSDYRGRPLNASCNLTLVYPNHTYVFTDYLMTPSIVQGNYYRTFTVPNEFGVYTEFVNCSVEVRPSYWIYSSSSNSIHVNPAFDFLVNISQNITSLQEQVQNISEDMESNFTYTNWLITQINETCGNVSQNCTLNANYTNQLIINSTDNITQQINATRNEAYTWYIDLRNRIYQCCQKWLEDVNDLIPSGAVQRVPLGGGVTQGGDRSIWKRILGGD